MSREVKRVPLDFDWEIGKIWSGYLMKECSESCEDCRKLAKIKGLKLNNAGCPIINDLELPEGKGYQMWETLEGSPISPVFETPEQLAKWLTDNKASSCGMMTSTYEEWLRYILKNIQYQRKQ